MLHTSYKIKVQYVILNFNATTYLNKFILCWEQWEEMESVN